MKATPLGGLIVCSECISDVFVKFNESPIYYFGRCFRDVFRLCTQECSHCELANPKVHEGTPKILSGYCHATSENFFNLQGEHVVPGSAPVVLRRRPNDEFIAALFLTTQSKFLEEDGGGNGNGDGGGEEGKQGGYREGNWE